MMTLIEKLEKETSEARDTLADISKYQHYKDLEVMQGGKIAGLEIAIEIVKQHQPTTVYELIYEGGEGYYSIMHSLDKSVCEQFIERVREYDAQYKIIDEKSMQGEDVEQDSEDWENNHPLKSFSDLIVGWGESLRYWFHCEDYKPYADNLKITEHELDKVGKP